MKTRRGFLTASSSLALLSFAESTPAFLMRAAAASAASNAGRVLVVVQLSGGNDGLNTIVPYRNEIYRRARPSLAIGADQVLKIDGELGFHPAMRGFADQLEQGRLSLIQGVGYANPNRSHFESMDIWHSARTSHSSRSLGWLGRMLDELPPDSGDAPALHFGDETQPLALATLRTPVSSVGSLERFRLDVGGRAALRRAIQESAESDRGSSNDLLSFVQASTINALAASERVDAAVKSYRAAVDYPKSGLAEKLQRIAQLIDAGFNTRIFYVSLDGFDTHATQAAAHAGLLEQLSGAVSAFLNDLHAHQHLDRVLLMAFSEFGRRVAENASQGTDHGAAAPMFVAGSRVRTGLIGHHPRLDDLDDGDPKFHTDFRRVYATILARWFQQPAGEILGQHYEPVDFLNSNIG